MITQEKQSEEDNTRVEEEISPECSVREVMQCHLNLTACAPA